MTEKEGTESVMTTCIYSQRSIEDSIFRGTPSIKDRKVIRGRVPHRMDI